MTSAPSGAPGRSTFSLEGRRAPALYLTAWILSIGGLGLFFIGVLSSSPTAALVLAVGGLTAVALGLAAGAGSQIVDRRDRNPDRYRGPAPLLVFFAFFSTVAAIGLILIRSGLLNLDGSVDFLAQGVIQALAYVFFVWLFVVKSGSLSWAQMGWPTWHGRDLRASLRSIGFAVAVVLPATLAILVVGGLAAALLDVDVPSVLPTPETRIEALAVALSAALIVPIGEELFFRGFALTAWLRDLGPRAALIRSSVFFALIHVVNIRTDDLGQGLAQVALQMIALLPLALVLGWLFLRHGMVGAITGHITYNSFLLFLLLLSTYLPQQA